MHSIKIKDFEISNNQPFTLIAGPCVIENRKHAIKMAKLIYEICQITPSDLNLSTIRSNLPWIYLETRIRPIKFY